MDTLAVVLEQPRQLVLDRLPLTPRGDDDVLVDIAWSGISTGTERLLYTGQMPSFPGMGYPLVPGYESIGRVIEASAGSPAAVGATVFVPGARCFGDVRGLFGGAAARLVVAASRVTTVDAEWGEAGVLLALAATAQHALALHGVAPPDLIVGHGVLGRLLARIAVASGHPAPVVWDSNAQRHAGATGYAVLHPDADPCTSYRSIFDVSGGVGILDTLVKRMAPGGEIVLAGFYAAPLSLAFPPAFMREARFRVAAEWRQSDLDAVIALVRSGRLSLEGLITHKSAATDAAQAYRTAFDDPACLKMILDWRNCS